MLCTFRKTKIVDQVLNKQFTGLLLVNIFAYLIFKLK